MDCFVCNERLANEDEIESGICDTCFAASQTQPFELFVKFAIDKSFTKHPADLF